MLKQKGYSKLGLASLIGKKVGHSALRNAKILHKFYNKTDVCIMLEDCFTCHKIEQYLTVKLPIKIQTLYKLSRECKSNYYLQLLLLKCVKEKTSLNQKQVLKIALWYFKDIYVLHKTLDDNNIYVFIWGSDF